MGDEIKSNVLYIAIEQYSCEFTFTSVRHTLIYGAYTYINARHISINVAYLCKCEAHIYKCGLLM